MKLCPRCNLELAFDAFYKSSAAQDGLSSYCKSCSLAYAKKWREENMTPEKVSEYKKRFGKSHPGYYTQKKKEWIEKNPEKAKALNAQKSKRKYLKKMLAKHGPGYVVGAPENKRVGDLSPEQIKMRRSARVKARRAVVAGKLVKMPCEVCGASESEMHHVAYDKPLLVTWLCEGHHREVHSC